MAAYDGEVLGLQASENGRSCLHHPCRSIVGIPNCIIRFKTTVIDGVNQNEGTIGIPEGGIKAVHTCKAWYSKVVHI